MLKVGILQSPMTYKHKKTGKRAQMIHMNDLVLLLAILLAGFGPDSLTLAQLGTTFCTKAVQSHKSFLLPLFLYTVVVQSTLISN